MWFLPIPAHFAGACALAWLANWIGLMGWRRSAAAHWSERARLLWPARVTASANLFVLPLLLYEGHQLLSPGTPKWWMANGLAACMGVLLASYPLERAVFPELNFRLWLGRVAVIWGLRLSAWIAFIGSAFLMPKKFGWGTAAVAAGYLTFHFALQWGLAVRVLGWLKALGPPDERLRRIVRERSERAGIPMPKTWIFGGVQALAFAFPTTGELLFSRRLLEICSHEEVAAVCAHELAHLAESKVTLAGRLLGSLRWFPIIFMVPCLNSFGAVSIVLLPLSVYLLKRFALWLSQRMEKRADERATASQIEEGSYARALEKLYRENSIPAVNANNQCTHPHLYDRMLAAGITPDFPRPRRPSKMTWVGQIYLWGMAFLFGVFGSVIVRGR